MNSGDPGLGFPDRVLPHIFIMSNKRAKELLIKRYGNIDFLDELKVKIPESKTYKSKGQLKRMKQLTYHHIFEKQYGGQATVENGALLTAEHHE